MLRQTIDLALLADDYRLDAGPKNCIDQRLVIAIGRTHADDVGGRDWAGFQFGYFTSLQWDEAELFLIDGQPPCIVADFAARMDDEPIDTRENPSGKKLLPP